MNKSQSEILIPALRQYKHNNGDDGFVIAYDESTTDQIVIGLQNTIIAHKASVNNAALAVIMGIGISEKHGKELLKSIHKGLAPNVKISY